MRAGRIAPADAAADAASTREGRMPSDLSEGSDFANADRGLVATLQPGVVRDAAGRVVWDVDAVAAAMSGERPETVDRSLWRQCRLTAKQGLYEVTDGVYQVRGLDLSNMTLIESERGVVVVDPLISAETAAAALALYRQHRGGPAGHRCPLHPLPPRTMPTPATCSRRPSSDSATAPRTPPGATATSRGHRSCGRGSRR
jgi:alkyl sulfatase BDS1-like metallo-beta-lactamase superfamily hydrolase